MAVRSYEIALLFKVFAFGFGLTQLSQDELCEAEEKRPKSPDQMTVQGISGSASAQGD